MTALTLALLLALPIAQFALAVAIEDRCDRKRVAHARKLIRGDNRK